MAEFLGEHYAGRARDVSELGWGDWSRAFSFRLDGRDLVARFGAYGEDFAGISRRCVRRPDLPVPEVETGRALGGAYAISQRCFGHHQATGLDVPSFGERLRCYELHIGLTHLAYCAFAGRDHDLHAVAQRTREILGPGTR